MPYTVDWSPEHRLIACHIDGPVSGDAVYASSTVMKTSTRLY